MSKERRLKYGEIIYSRIGFGSTLYWSDLKLCVRCNCWDEWLQIGVAPILQLPCIVQTYKGTHHLAQNFLRLRSIRSGNHKCFPRYVHYFRLPLLSWLGAWQSGETVKEFSPARECDATDGIDRNPGRARPQVGRSQRLS